MMNNFDVAVLIGRFQPFHQGHASLLALALSNADTVIVVLGSAFCARSVRNPFTWQERAAMISASLSEADQARVSFIPVRDYYDDLRWANTVQNKVTQAIGGQGDEALHIALIGYVKDASSYYLQNFPQWQWIEAERVVTTDATQIRQQLFAAKDMQATLDMVAAFLPLSVLRFIREWVLTPDCAGLVQEHLQLQKYKDAWKAAPYSPVFCTVDAVVKVAGHVLLVQRGGYPGKGLWALPGGFLDQQELLLQGAIRELIEETNLAVSKPELEEALVDVRVFDHPARSQRGRTITHAHFFDLRLAALPEIVAADDAAQATWFPVTELCAMEEQFFDDHFHILDQFLQLIAEGN